MYTLYGLRRVIMSMLFDIIYIVNVYRRRVIIINMCIFRPWRDRKVVEWKNALSAYVYDILLLQPLLLLLPPHYHCYA